MFSLENRNLNSRGGIGVVAQAYKPALGRQKQRGWVRDQLWLPSPNRYYIEKSLVFIIIIKIAGYTRLWWYMPLIPTLKRQRRANVWVWKQPGLRSEFQNNQNYTEKHCLGKALTYKNCWTNPVYLRGMHKHQSMGAKGQEPSQRSLDGPRTWLR